MLTLEDVDRAIRNIPIPATVDTAYSANRQRVDIKMTSEHVRYSISADLDGTTYLGGIASTLDGRGGNDLWDGALDDDVLANLCWDIECYDARWSSRTVDGTPPADLGRYYPGGNRWSG